MWSERATTSFTLVIAASFTDPVIGRRLGRLRGFCIIEYDQLFIELDGGVLHNVIFVLTMMSFLLKLNVTATEPTVFWYQKS